MQRVATTSPKHCFRGEAAPLTLWASISENRTAVKPLYASMAGHDPASGKNWSSKPKQQVKLSLNKNVCWRAIFSCYLVDLWPSCRQIPCSWSCSFDKSNSDRKGNDKSCSRCTHIPLPLPPLIASSSTHLIQTRASIYCRFYLRLQTWKIKCRVSDYLNKS